jgi:hypothetical protein
MGTVTRGDRVVIESLSLILVAVIVSLMTGKAEQAYWDARHVMRLMDMHVVLR